MDGNGGNAAAQNVSVANFSQMGSNQTTISGVLQKIETALPNNTTCNNWLQGSGTNQSVSGLQQIQTVLSANNFGHGTVSVGNAVAYGIAAFSGNKNPDKTLVAGVPISAVFTVNDIGGFFNANFPNSPPYRGQQQLVGTREYIGNTLRAQAAILIHETAHQITVSGFQDDFGKPKVVKANDKLVDTNCRQLIEGLQ
jgi:hypothetical protein